MSSYGYHPIQSKVTGTTHGYTQAGEIRGEPQFYTACGRSVDPWSDAWETQIQEREISCGTCRRSLQGSKEHRIARDLTEIGELLVQDIAARPGAYIHADHELLSRIERLCQAAKTDLGI